MWKGLEGRRMKSFPFFFYQKKNIQGKGLELGEAEICICLIWLTNNFDFTELSNTSSTVIFYRQIKVSCIQFYFRNSHLEFWFVKLNKWEYCWIKVSCTREVSIVCHYYTFFAYYVYVSLHYLNTHDTWPLIHYIRTTYFCLFWFRIYHTKRPFFFSISRIFVWMYVHKYLLSSGMRDESKSGEIEESGSGIPNYYSRIMR
jgi:hypothetical protein